MSFIVLFFVNHYSTIFLLKLNHFTELENSHIWNFLGEVQIWKSKYETEAAARAEEVEELRRKFNARIQEQEEHIEALLVKVNNLEKQKSRLQSEVEVLIIDLEKANNTARELQKRVEQLERINIDLKTRLDETVQLYEQSQRDLRNKISELQRTVHELDKTREQKDQLARENKKLAGKYCIANKALEIFTSFGITS